VGTAGAAAGATGVPGSKASGVTMGSNAWASPGKSTRTVTPLRRPSRTNLMQQQALASMTSSRSTSPDRRTQQQQVLVMPRSPERYARARSPLALVGGCQQKQQQQQQQVSPERPIPAASPPSSLIASSQARQFGSPERRTHIKSPSIILPCRPSPPATSPQRPAHPRQLSSNPPPDATQQRPLPLEHSPGKSSANTYASYPDQQLQQEQEQQQQQQERACGSGAQSTLSADDADGGPGGGRAHDSAPSTGLTTQPPSQQPLPSDSTMAEARDVGHDQGFNKGLTGNAVSSDRGSDQRLSAASGDMGHEQGLNTGPMATAASRGVGQHQGLNTVPMDAAASGDVGHDQGLNTGPLGKTALPGRGNDQVNNKEPTNAAASSGLGVMSEAGQANNAAVRHAGAGAVPSKQAGAGAAPSRQAPADAPAVAGSTHIVEDHASGRSDHPSSSSNNNNNSSRSSSRTTAPMPWSAMPPNRLHQHMQTSLLPIPQTLKRNPCSPVPLDPRHTSSLSHLRK